MKLKEKLLIMIKVTNIYLVQNLVSSQQRTVLLWYCCDSDVANLVNKTDFDNKLLNFNKRTNSNKTKHLLVENELNELSKKVEGISKVFVFL